MFVQRLLSFTFQLGQGQFGNGGFDTVTIDGLRATARITKAGGPSMSAAEVDIYGMLVTLQRRNVITINAGDAVSGLSTVFRGTITSAWADFTGARMSPFTSRRASVGLRLWCLSRRVVSKAARTSRRSCPAWRRRWACPSRTTAFRCSWQIHTSPAPRERKRRQSPSMRASSGSSIAGLLRYGRRDSHGAA
jgi:hypothetical protein